MSRGRTLGLRLFIEGIEVDVVSATVDAGIQRPSTASIQIPACDAAHRMEPRTLVHLFYMESGYYIGDSNDKPAPSVNSNPTTSGKSPLDKAKPYKFLDTADLSNWRLLFAGEILGYGYTRVGELRHIVLNCGDFTNYWDSIQLYWGKEKLGSHSYKRTTFTGASHVRAGKRKATSSYDIVKLLMARPSTIPNLPGMLGGIVNLLESAVGVYDLGAKKRYRGVNDFLSQAELRLKLTRTIAASPNDDSSSQFLNTKSFKRYMSQVSRRMNSTASYLALAQTLLGKCYHQWASLTAPPLIEAGEEVKVRYVVAKGPLKFTKKKDRELFGSVRATYDIYNKRVVDNIRDGKALAREANTVDKDTHKFVSSGGKAVVDESGVKDFSKAADETGLWEKDFSVGTSEYRQDLEPGDPMHTALYTLEKAKKEHIEHVRKDKAGNFKDRASNISADGSKVEEINFLLEKVMKGLIRKGKGKARFATRKIKLGSRLHMSLFTPDIYMVPPPTCNVLFPDHYSSISFSRRWMSEITRLWMHGRTERGKDKKDVYFSPNTDILASANNSIDATQAVKKGVSFLMNHEIMTGIIPKIEGLGDNDIFARLHKRTVDKSSKKRKQDAAEGRDMAGQAIFSPQEHLQRASNYLFFAKRYGSRSMNVTARFSPQIIVGVPCLILDPMRGERSRFGKANAENQAPLGTHYLGVVAAIRHVINASGGAQTTLQLNKCRAHNEGVDLFAPPDGYGYARTEKIQRRRVRKKVAQGVVPLKGEGPGGDAIIDKNDFSNLYTETRKGEYIEQNKFKGTKGKSYTMSITRFDFDSKIETNTSPAHGQFTGDVGTGPVQPQDRHGRSLLVAESEGSFIPLGVYVDINETKTITNKTPVKFSFEGTTTPPWFSPIYMPASIGEQFYKKMFGCKSILDSAILADFGEQGSGVAVAAEGQHIVSFDTDDGSGIKEVAIPSQLLNQAETIQVAAENLAEFWLGLNEINADIDLFIDVYTNRKYANILEVLGNTNPHMLVTAHNGVPPKIGDTRIDGFHGFAFGDFDQFDKFPEYEPLSNLDLKTPKRRIDPRMDTRRAKYRAVLRYKDEISRTGANSTYGFGQPTDSGGQSSNPGIEEE